MTRTIAETITSTGETNVTRMVLRSSTLNIRSEFRNVINSRIIENNSRLPSTPSVESISVIDRDIIIELNNTTTSERRVELMESIINHQNSNENRALLIENSSPQVRTYLHDLLIRSANNSNISEEDLYRIGNIFLYTISNLDIDGLFLRDVIQNMRESMVLYNTNQIFSILNSQVVDYNSYLETTRLATETQLQERVNTFNTEIDERIAQNRRRILYTGVGLLTSMALSSLGVTVPVLPISLFARSLESSIAVRTLSSNSIEDIIRLRDVWDAALKRMLDMIQK